MISLMAALIAAPAAHAQACQALTEAPESMQVAWVSRAGARVGGGHTLEVVRVADLRQWVRTEGTDVGRLLQGLGMAPRDSTRKARKDWKITLFDVQSSWLCRPLEGEPPGQDALGVLSCDERDAKAVRPNRYGYSGCGYTLDTGASSRGLDVFRVDWSTASAWGFCVLPLERFLGGA
jgi:hypothetical protein